jgi:fumarate reductase flavoprotein subunit
VANSTVFGGIAGDAMAAWVAREGSFRVSDARVVDVAIARAERPFHSGEASDLEAIREQLHTTMWDNAGIVRDAASLTRAATSLDALAQQLHGYALPSAARTRAFNLTWHDWLNLTNLVAVSKAIVRAGEARQNSRGAHFRADFPEPGELSASTFVRVQERGGALDVESVPVRFTRVRPGATLLAS